MARVLRCLALVGLLLAVSGGAQAADDLPSGSIWKIIANVGPGQQPTFWLLKLENKDGKWSAETIGTRPGIPKATVADVSTKGGSLRFGLVMQGGRFSFEGKLPAEGGKKVLGSLQLDRLVPAELVLTDLKSLDLFEYNKEIVAKAAGGPDLIDAAVALLGQAAGKKAKVEDVRSWASKAFKASEAYGGRYHMDLALRISETLVGDKEYVPVALQYARQAERLLSPGDKPVLQRRVLNALADVLQKAGKEDEAKEVTAKINKLPLVAVTKYAGRPAKSDQVVLVELFTGAECPPCVAADLAFDALAKTYTPKEVILLQYHLHIPGPDPLTNSDTVARSKFYEDEVEGTPTIIFNGRPGAGGGGRKESANEKYDEYVGVIDPLIDGQAKAKVQVGAVQKGNKIEITGNVSDVEKPGDNVRLRFALVEEMVKYQGGNKLEAHHHVVRSLPGGANGFALKEKTLKQTVTVDLDELRKKTKEYLDDYNKKREFPNKERPLELKNLRVVAFVQNDATKQVLQSAETEIKAAP
jgi:hypothetical protein